MFISKAKYEVEKLKAQQRIEYLENLICPMESHDWVEIDYHFDENFTSWSCNKCRKCGKLIK